MAGKCIGMVWGITDPGGERKAYIGEGFGESQKEDEQYIAQFGQPVWLTHIERPYKYLKGEG